MKRNEKKGKKRVKITTDQISHIGQTKQTNKQITTTTNGYDLLLLIGLLLFLIVFFLENSFGTKQILRKKTKELPISVNKSLIISGKD
ncbi:hypothetical protein DERP_009071 [Dermatophagoides pteronyssinus]|uniref:Uncharacterized protein n=1 Tax=Dermatophagoides pteronyssinus TaxID=6956 RepID=A0ABQ8JGC6_DERPT|nr:hypothetical protein DERP_009071 [Dermatophagoides pteronyssinus]